MFITIENLGRFFEEDSRSHDYAMLTGQNLAFGIPSIIKFVTYWGQLILIAIGLIVMVNKYFLRYYNNFMNMRLTRNKVEEEFIFMAIACFLLSLIILLLPMISYSYPLYRFYFGIVVIFSLYFIIGGKAIGLIDLNWIPHIGNRIKFKVEPSYLMTIILLLFFMCTSGAIYQLFGQNTSVLLNSEGKGYDLLYLHDQECSAAMWLKNYVGMGAKFYTADYYCKEKLISQGGIPQYSIDFKSFLQRKTLDGYVLLGYNNVINGIINFENNTKLSEYADMFARRNEIYCNGGSQAWV